MKAPRLAHDPPTCFERDTGQWKRDKLSEQDDTVSLDWGDVSVNVRPG